MLPQPALLLALVSKELGQCKPFDGLFITAFMGGDHTRQARSHFGSQRDLPLPLVFEVIELPDDFIAAFSGEELQRFQGWAVVLTKAVTAGDPTPGVKDVLARVATPHIGLRQRFGIKVTKAWQTFHKIRTRR